ncbi:Uncharacterized protein FWK35_00001108 [Aphis craccivora]|uniref:Uncharacterized protein n=1 Tax=Aphis craccivora TaxID=307492 RepID=A0A6G0ZPL1_APHCR|nr:Uncharacterized protein FWK35_00001108 [Aphis craccivora]
MARVSINAIQQIFGNRIISKTGDIHWPPQSPNLSVCDFFLWGYLNSKSMHRNLVILMN